MKISKQQVRYNIYRKRYSSYVKYVHNGRWILAPHLQLVCDNIEKLINREIKQNILIISMPPQHGKSQCVTETLSSWYLGNYPDKRVIEISYGDDLAQRFGRRNKEKIIEFGKQIFNIELSKVSDTDFEVKNHKGSMISKGIMAGLTGNPADLIIIDDPIKNRQESDSETYRNRVWEEFINSINTRLSATGIMILIMCLTGDTSILMADGTEKELRNIRVGDNIATYKDGKLAVSTVKNWKCQGLDYTFTIRMESGIIIKGNERHPFLVERNGHTEWVKIKNLKIGDKILRAKKIGESGKEFCVQKKTAISLQNVKDIATPTTISPFGQVDIGLHQSTQNQDEVLDLNSDMESVLPNMTQCLLHKTENVPCVENCQQQTLEHIGVGNYALTTTMLQEKCEDYCATTATLRLDMEKQKKYYSSPLDMFEIIHDEIVDIVESGYEDVFDIQVESTENFIANGLVSHNTRWHEDDLAGRLLKHVPNKCYEINIPLEAEENDILGRNVGDSLFPAIGKDNAWLKEFKQSYKTQEGARSWDALMQGKPTAQEGSMIKRYWWKYWIPKGSNLPKVSVKNKDGITELIDTIEVPDTFDRMLQTWDLAFKKKEDSDFISGQVMANKGANIFLLDLINERLSFTETLKAIENMTAKWPNVIVKLIEDKANGPAIIDMLHHKIGGIIPVEPEGSKQARVEAVTPIIESGNVYIPHPMLFDWVNEFIDQSAKFPKVAHDDMVDAFSQGLFRFIYASNPEKKHKLPDDIPDDLRQDLENDPQALQHWLAEREMI
jgi:predicted phage terminase large subunit-like protein